MVKHESHVIYIIDPVVGEEYTYCDIIARVEKKGGAMEAGEHRVAPEPLSRLAAGKQAIIHSLQGEHDFRSRVANLGFTAGTPISVRQNYGHGPILVSLRGTLVALGRAEAAKVLVRLGE